MASQTQYHKRLALAALGVVFGDIGTSPLYAFREALYGHTIDSFDILGVLSLVLWSLILVISVKYLTVIIRADNDGEGGILALLALLKRHHARLPALFGITAIFGAGLLIGDGMLTPAISVLSAVEGIGIIAPELNNVILPIASVILLGLFTLQSRGTHHVGSIFGPVLLLWFICLAVLGLRSILQNPAVLKAIHPFYAFHFLQTSGSKGFLILGGVFLVVTGGEALYADIGHFGKRPIRQCWFFVVLPALILNYFGQGALLLRYPEAISNPFFSLAPQSFMPALVALSTAAAIIASQAMISATFSLTKQAILLGYYPKLPIMQTSSEHAGQIYIPQINALLAIGTFFLVFVFQSSSSLAHAYGIAVNLTMLMVTIMVAFAARFVWQWSWLKTTSVFFWFVAIDMTFLLSNSHKILSGGWLPIVFALLVLILMLTWQQGVRYVRDYLLLQPNDLEKTIRQLQYRSVNKLKGLTAIFITDTYDRSGGSFLHFLKLSRAVPENILIVNYQVLNQPYVPLRERFSLSHTEQGIYELVLNYGFMDTVSIPRALERLNDSKLLPFDLDVNAITYFVETPYIIASRQKHSLPFFWQERLFAFLMRNYSVNINIAFYKIPYNRTIAIGSYFVM